MISRVAAVEIPVSVLEKSVQWYAEILDLAPIGEVTASAEAVMLRFPGSPADVPGVYLVRTDATERLGFHTAGRTWPQSIVDFYTDDLAAFHGHLTRYGVPTNRDSLDFAPGEPGGFGFLDPDGNSLGATNVSG